MGLCWCALCPVCACGAAGHNVCTWGSPSREHVPVPAIFSGVAAEDGVCPQGPAAWLTIATWASCGQIFWFQGPGQLAFDVKLVF